MSRTRKRFPMLPVAVAALMAAPMLPGATGIKSAHADTTVTVKGKVKVRVGRKHRVRRAHVRHRRHRTARPVVRLRIGGGVYVDGGVYVGRGYSEPPPPPPVYDCDGPPVPAYYTRPYYAPPPPAPVVAPVVASRPAPPRLPRIGIGVFAGGIEVGEHTSGEDVGLIGRVRLTDRLLIEGEVAQSEMDDDRVDRRLGASLVLDLMPRSRWSVQLMGGAGVTQVELGDGAWESDQEFGEVGVGMSFFLTRRLQLAADVRAGARAPVEGGPSQKALQDIAPDSEEEEVYSRGRLSAILYF